MSEQMAVMPYSHYEGACNAIREATGKTDKIKSGDFEAETRAAIAAGVGSSGKDLYLTHISGNDSGEITAEMLDGITNIKNFAFYNRQITKVVIPDSVTSIGGSAFSSCGSLTEAIIGRGMKDIYISVFGQCTSLSKVTFLGTPSMVQTNVFSGCIALMNIYVPWSEGAVANAPWGASNATIHYNSEVNE